MADIAGTNVLAPVVPFTTTDKNPTHLAIYGQGGLRTVADNTARNAIPAERCQEGMEVWVVATNKKWRLNSGYHTPLVDGDWTETGSIASETDPVWVENEPQYLKLSGRAGGQVMSGDYILDSILKNKEDSIVTLHVATTGNDTTGDGTSAKPFATLERACEEINKFVNVFYSIINIADGTYNNTYVNFPTTVRGIIQVTGNISNPNAVILNGNGSDCPLNITGGQAVDFEGFYIDNVGGANTITVDGASLKMKGVGISDGYGIYVNRAYVKFEASNAMGTMPIEVSQLRAAGIYAINSYVDIDVNLEITGTYIGIASVNGSVVRQGISTRRSVSVVSAGNTSETGSETGLQIYDATYYLFGTFNYNGTETTGMSSIGIDLGSKGLLFSPSSLSEINIENASKGLVGKSASIQGLTPQMTFTNVDTEVYFDYSTIYAWTVTPTFFKSDNYAFDSRYVQFDPETRIFLKVRPIPGAAAFGIYDDYTSTGFSNLISFLAPNAPNGVEMNFGTSATRNASWTWDNDAGGANPYMAYQTYGNLYDFGFAGRYHIFEGRLGSKWYNKPRASIGGAEFIMGVDNDTKRFGILTETPKSTFENNSSFARKTETISVDTTLGENHYRVLVDDDSTIALPDATLCQGREYNIIRVGTSDVDIETTSSQTISGAGSLTLTSQWQSVVVASDGSNWIRCS